MKAARDHALYVLEDESSGELLVSAEELLGFFSEPAAAESDVHFLGVHEAAVRGKRRADDAVLKVVDPRGRDIGEYFVGRAVHVLSEDSKVTYRFLGGGCEHAAAAGFWRRRAAGDLRAGEWAHGSEEEQEAWLHVARNYWFTTGRRAARYGHSESVALEGKLITSRPAFYCALGEAVNGVGGYLGSNLDALAECLSRNLGGLPLVEVVWHNFESSRSALEVEFVESALAVLTEFDVSVRVS